MVAYDFVYFGFYGFCLFVYVCMFLFYVSFHLRNCICSFISGISIVSFHCVDIVLYVYSFLFAGFVLVFVA